MLVENSYLKSTILVGAMLLIFVLLLLASVFIYSFLPGSGQTSNPAVQIQLNMDDYKYSLSLDDFRRFKRFSDFDCSECDFSQGGKFFVGELYSGDGIVVRLSMGERPFLNIFYYGNDSSNLASHVGKFLHFIRNAEAFSEGYSLIDPLTNQVILQKDEAQWLVSLKQKQYLQRHSR